VGRGVAIASDGWIKIKKIGERNRSGKGGEKAKRTRRR
jgi:hypothetical protein